MLLDKRLETSICVQVRNSTSGKSKYDLLRSLDLSYSYLGQFTNVYSLCPSLHLKLLILLLSFQKLITSSILFLHPSLYDKPFPVFLNLSLVEPILPHHGFK